MKKPPVCFRFLKSEHLKPPHITVSTLLCCMLQDRHTAKVPVLPTPMMSLSRFMMGFETSNLLTPGLHEYKLSSYGLFYFERQQVFFIWFSICRVQISITATAIDKNRRLAYLNRRDPTRQSWDAAGTPRSRARKSDLNRNLSDLVP